MSAQESFVLNSFQAKCHLTKSNLIEVEITSPDFDDKNEDENVRLATTISYFVLGQEALSTWLGKVTAKRGPSDIKPTSAAREFKSDFELLKTVALNKLPDKYYYELKVSRINISRPTIAKTPWIQTSLLSQTSFLMFCWQSCNRLLILVDFQRTAKRLSPFRRAHLLKMKQRIKRFLKMLMFR